MRALWLRKVAAGAWPKAHLRASRLNVSSGATAAEAYSHGSVRNAPIPDLPTLTVNGKVRPGVAPRARVLHHVCC
jgi:hypothetical protein